MIVSEGSLALTIYCSLACLNDCRLKIVGYFFQMNRKSSCQSALQSQNQVAGSAKRMDELDFLKAVFILLMVAFHLVYIGNKYPYAKAVVYTFHMPGFLLISGYLANMHKTAGKFFRGMWRLLLPYLIMEGAYIILAAFLPIREHIDSLTVGTFLQHLLLKPLGPYWYLHTLVICSVMYFAIMRLPLLANWMKWTILLFAYGALAFGLHLISFTHACYFAGGIAIRLLHKDFISFFRFGLWGFIPFAALLFWPDQLHSGTFVGVLIVYCVICGLLGLYPYFKTNGRLLFIGRNTLVILLFSPVFTLLVKPLVPLLAFDPTGMLFLIIAVSLAVGGSLVIARVMEKTHTAVCLFGQSSILH